MLLGGDRARVEFGDIEAHTGAYVDDQLGHPVAMAQRPGHSPLAAVGRISYPRQKVAQTSGTIPLGVDTVINERHLDEILVFGVPDLLCAIIIIRLRTLSSGSWRLELARQTLYLGEPWVQPGVRVSPPSGLQRPGKEGG